MTTTAYITTKTAAAATRAMKELGYATATIAQVQKRQVMNVVSEFAGGSIPAQRELEAAILNAIRSERE